MARCELEGVGSVHAENSAAQLEPQNVIYDSIARAPGALNTKPETA